MNLNRRQFVLGAAAAGGLVYLADRTAAAPAHRRQAATVDAVSAHRINPAAATAVAYAAGRVGGPYVWGGTGPAGYDCSGLVMMAYRSAGVTIERTSSEQWRSLPHVSADQVQEGDLVFFIGRADGGTRAAPGHVAIATGPHRIVQAYGLRTGIIASSYGLSTSLEGVRAEDIVGYARPTLVRS